MSSKKIHEIKSLDIEGNTITIKGEKVILSIGDKKIAFIINDVPIYGLTLTHYSSGMAVGPKGSITAIKATKYRSGSLSVSNREAAKKVIEDIIKRVGVERMLVVMSSAPVLNVVK